MIKPLGINKIQSSTYELTLALGSFWSWLLDLLKVLVSNVISRRYKYDGMCWLCWSWWYSVLNWTWITKIEHYFGDHQWINANVSFWDMKGLEYSMNLASITNRKNYRHTNLPTLKPYVSQSSNIIEALYRIKLIPWSSMIHSQVLPRIEIM